MSLMLEWRYSNEGKKSDWNMGLAVIYFFGFILAYPVFKLLFLRLKQRGNLEHRDLLSVFGVEYKEYIPC